MNRLTAIVVLLLSQAFLTACGTNLQIVRPGEVRKPIPQEQREEAVAASQLVTENPYLEHKRSVSGDARKRFEQAMASVDSQDWESARVELLSLTEKYPELSGPRLNLALLYRETGEIEKADAMFQECIASNVDNVGAYSHYGVFLREQGRFRDAEEIYLKGLSVWEQHADTHRNIGVLYDLYLGEQEKALQHYRRYQQLMGADDRAVAGWIADLERQLMMLAQGD